MKIAYFDCVAGISGDMVLGALVDAGLAVETLRQRLEALHLDGFDLHAHRVAKNAFTATKVDVIVADNVPERHLGDIVRIVTESDLPPEIKDQAVAMFHRLGETEAGIHGASLDEVHLHELGGVDTVVDVVGALVGLQALGVERVYASPVPLGRGFIRGAHGQIPLPAPATIGLLKGVPIVGSPLQMETVTPTGAVLLSSLAAGYGPIPAMTLEAIGYGAGSRDLPIPNLLRLLIGEVEPSQVPHHHHHSHSHGENAHHHNHDHDELSHAVDIPTHPHPHHPHSHSHTPTHSHSHPHTPSEEAHDSLHPHSAHPQDAQHPCDDTTTLVVLETNIDDLNPEVYEYVMQRLFDAGALDVFFSPIQMKKNRPAILLRVLCKPDAVETMTQILFAETTTLGVRAHNVTRYALTRESQTVETDYGNVRVKVAHLDDGQAKAAPEYDDCRRLAEAHGVPLRVVYQAAVEATVIKVIT